ncbi:SCO family protein [Aliisedimentitalea scapharcae]|uniref:SCO family protein n=1 Tax=Aliisedimentitalea scapharcae TaxID=1524259 RepID=A0ABZ2XPJ5_9RHOB|nr:SCO family protein [Rhodobacteraceae bacterium M382]
MRLAAAFVFAAMSWTSGGWAGNAPLPFDVGGAYELIDQHGNTRTQADPGGKGQLLFFGYANCPSICTAAMPMMAVATDELADAGIDVTPVMITVDRDRDQPGNMDGPLLDLHPDFIGLSGSAEALQVAYDAFSVQQELAFVDPEYGPVFTHGSFVYLLDAEGKVLTLFPPITDPERVVALARKYLRPDS